MVNMLSYGSTALTRIILAACIIGMSQGLMKMNAVRVPSVIQEGDMSSVVLDCDYSLTDPFGLVVKWYFAPTGSVTYRRIYQWIQGQRPLAFGAFKNFVDLSYKASGDANLEYRAMHLLRPARNMSGSYQCVVETYNDGTLQKSANMLIFVPQATLQLSQDKVDDDTVRVSCSADDVYPMPTMDIKLGNKVLKAQDNLTEGADMLFDIKTSADVDFADLPDEPTEVTCELSLPEANYTVRQEGLIYKANSANSLMPYLHMTVVIYVLHYFLMV